jgi:hypothetical protein
MSRRRSRAFRPAPAAWGRGGSFASVTAEAAERAEAQADQPEAVEPPPGAILAASRPVAAPPAASGTSGRS